MPPFTDILLMKFFVWKENRPAQPNRQGENDGADAKDAGENRRYRR
jgi:hypothetical protein